MAGSNLKTVEISQSNSAAEADSHINWLDFEQRQSDSAAEAYSNWRTVNQNHSDSAAGASEKMNQQAVDLLLFDYTPSIFVVQGPTIVEQAENLSKPDEQNFELINSCSGLVKLEDPI